MPAPVDPTQLTPGADGPAYNALAITPNDSADLAKITRSLWVGVGGDLKVTTVNGDTVEFRNIPSGSLLPVACKRIYATGQTGTIASAIVGLY